jgi:hypothetical protein
VVSQQPAPTVQNHFMAGLKTEFTGLNFPENAATDTQNCVYTLTGDVNRRGGINYEANFVNNLINQSGIAKCSYRWKNVGGDGQTQVLVQQIGNTLYFYLSSSATIASPLSTTLLSSVVNINGFKAVGNGNNVSFTECQFADGNGYLLIFHKDCDPFFCTFNAATKVITPSPINFQIRDVIGIPELNIADNFRPAALSAEHNYNLLNQGWTQGSGWSASGTTQPCCNWPQTGVTGVVFNISSQTNTTTLTIGSEILIQGNGVNPGGFNEVVSLLGNVSAYSATTPGTVTVTVASCDHPGDAFGTYAGGTFFPGAVAVTMQLVNQGFINTWFGVFQNYPANSDIWWLYKDTTGKFNPATTGTGFVQQNVGAAPKGTFILNPWRQLRSTVSSISGLTDITTTSRPSTGCWFQGRVFYAGNNSSQVATGDEPYTTWTENIYFSKIVETSADFGKCYQQNDPTSQDLFSLLPSDGGVITIQGCGAVYKLFPLRFGVLVFASNGIWFIGGSTGVGFAANDFTVTKISSIESISGTSFIEVTGYPYFWNQEGIYKVVPSQQPGSAHSPDIQLDVQNLTLGTILTYYQGIPLISQQFARGDYDQINYVVSWGFRSTAEAGLNNRYSYDTVLNLNTATGAFYPYTLPTTSASSVCDIKYMQNPGGPGEIFPVFKYITQNGINITFSEENDFTRYVDFFNENNVGHNYTSYFVTGYTLSGQGLRKIQTPYVYVFSRNPVGVNAYGIRSIWDFAGSATLGVQDNLGGKWSTRQVVTNNQTDFSMVYRKIRLRGRGLAVQIRVDSVQGLPFDIMGWSVWNEVNPGI